MVQPVRAPGILRASEKLPSIDLGIRCALQRMWALESINRNLRIQTLRGQVVICQLRYASLVRQFDSECWSDGQKAKIVRRRDESLKESHALQLMVDLLERQVREEQVHC
jgi:hypothetical protein